MEGGGGGSRQAGGTEAEHPGLQRWEKHKGLGSQIGEVGKRKRAGEAGSKGGKQHRAGHKGLVRPLGQGAGQANRPSFGNILGTIIDAPCCPRTRTYKDGMATDLQFAEESDCPTRPGQDIPKALAVVELALSQVALDQMDVLLAGCAGTAERGALGLL